MSIDATDLEIAKLVVTTGATAVAAVFGIRIAVSQRDIARQQKNIAREAKEIAAAKLNFDLFKERYEVFYLIWGYLSDGSSRMADSPLRTDFTNLIPKAAFLFGPEIADYMREADRKRTQLIMANLEFQTKQSPESSQVIRDNEGWFFLEATNCFKRFARYLDFSQWQTQDWATAKLPVAVK